MRDEAVEHYRARRYYQAIQAAEAAFTAAREGERGELATLLARFQSALGVELFNAGENRQAEEVFRQALGRAEDAYARFGLGFLHFIRLEDEAALRELAAAARLEADYAKTYKLRGLIEYRQGRSQEAVTSMKEALRLDPEDKEAKALFERWEREGKYAATFTGRRTAAFLFRLDPEIPAARVDEVVAMIETARKDLLARGMAPLRPVTVVLYSEKRFHQATGSFHWVGGVFDGQIKLPVPPKELREEVRNELRTAVRHELVHAAVREICPECPNWLNEGLAQHFEGPRSAADLRRGLREGALRRVRFRDVPARLWEVDDEEFSRWTYLQGLGFVEHLCADYHEFRLRLCLKTLAREGSVARAFELTYGAGLEQLENHWWEEVLRDG